MRMRSCSKQRGTSGTVISRVCFGALPFQQQERHRPDKQGDVALPFQAAQPFVMIDPVDPSTVDSSAPRATATCPTEGTCRRTNRLGDKGQGTRSNEQELSFDFLVRQSHSISYFSVIWREILCTGGLSRIWNRRQIIDSFIYQRILFTVLPARNLCYPI
jgi:hypothetical protein